MQLIQLDFSGLDLTLTNEVGLLPKVVRPLTKVHVQEQEGQNWKPINKTI